VTFVLFLLSNKSQWNRVLMTTSVVESNRVLMTIILKFYWTLGNLFSSPTKEPTTSHHPHPPLFGLTHTNTDLCGDNASLTLDLWEMQLLLACLLELVLFAFKSHQPIPQVPTRNKEGKIWVFVIHPKHTRITLLSWGTQPYRFCH
jgi:hypothetical protein